MENVDLLWEGSGGISIASSILTGEAPQIYQPEPKSHQ